MRLFLIPLISTLLLPSAVNAFPFGKNSDIIIKTDLGEKYVVKETATTIFINGLDQAYERISKNINYYKDELEKCVDGPLSLETCSEIYDTPEMKTRIKSWKNDLQAETESIHFIGVKFRPIFIDLNGNKQAKGYDRVGCLNPKLKEKTIQFWDYFTSIRRFKGQKNRSEYFNAPDEKSLIAYEQVKVKLCEKYAKF